VTEPSSEVVRVWFQMAGGPATAVGVGAEALAPDRVRLLFAPWAALNAAKADVYRVRMEDDGEIWAQEKVDASGFCAIRLVLTDNSPSDRSTPAWTPSWTNSQPWALLVRACSGWRSSTFHLTPS